jgi:TPR repeat protein
MVFGLILMATASLLQAGLDAHGRGDFVAARAALKPLAAQGSAVAETLLGGMAARGQGVKADPAAAAAWWFRAANRGYAPAQLALARAMADGRGLAIDKGRAWLWANRAMGAGGAAAAEAAVLAKRLEADVPEGERAALASEVWVAWP